MRKKVRKLTGLIMTLFLFVTGIYCEFSRADAAFLRAPVQTGGSCLLAGAPVVPDAQACDTELSGIRGNICPGQLTVRFANQRRDIRGSLSALFQNIFSVREGRSYSHFEKLRALSENQKELVTNYIHKSDGKKRIS